MTFLALLCKNLLRRKMRSTLTCCGVAVAVGTTVALLSIAQSFEGEALRAFAERGTDIVVIEDGVIDQLSSEIDEGVVERVRQLPGVRAVDSALIDLAALPAQGTTVTAMIQGWPHDNYSLDDLRMESGRRIQAGDGKVAMVGVALAEVLEKKRGDEIEIEGQPFRVIGVFESFVGFENISVIVPLPVLQEVMYRQDRITGFSLIVDYDGKDGQVIQSMCREINGLRDQQGQSLRLSAKPARDYVRQSAHNRLSHAMAWMTSAIACIVGAIGVLNTMVMAVAERVREIAILRAMGWNKRLVVQMIVGESLLISAVGALLGVAAALALIGALSCVPEIRGVIPAGVRWIAVAQGLGLAMLVGVAGGAYPALRAARLLPSEGLRHE